MVKRQDIDQWGALASSLCAVHCAAVGLATGLLPLLGLGFLSDPKVDFGFLGTAVLLGAWAARTGYKKHRSFLPSMFFLAGLIFVVVSHFVIGHRHSGDTHLHSVFNLNVPDEFAPLGTALAVLGGMTLVAFHFLNHRLANKATCGCAVCTVDDAISVSARPDVRP